MKHMARAKRVLKDSERKAGTVLIAVYVDDNGEVVGEQELQVPEGARVIKYRIHRLFEHV